MGSRLLAMQKEGGVDASNGDAMPSPREPVTPRRIARRQTSIGIELRTDVLLASLLSGDLERIQSVLAAAPELLDAPLNEMDQTVLHLLCFPTTNCPAILSHVLSLQPDVNRREAAGFTPLLYAAKSGLWATCHLLLGSSSAASVDVNAQSMSGWNALMLLASQPVSKSSGSGGEAEYASLLAKLKEAGIDASSVSKHGDTPLHLAALSNNSIALRFLMDSFDVDINAINIHGESPLFNAVRAGNLEAADLLLSGGADPELDSSKITSSFKGMPTALQVGKRRMKGSDSKPLRKLVKRMEKVVKEGTADKSWLAKKSEEKAQPVTGGFSATAPTSLSKSAGVRRALLGEQRSSSGTLPAVEEEQSDEKVDNEEEGLGAEQGDEAAEAKKSDAAIAYAPLKACFDDLIALGETARKLTRKKMKLTVTGGRKEKTFLATVSMHLHRMASCQHGSIRNYRTMMESNIQLQWCPDRQMYVTNVNWGSVFHHRMLQAGAILPLEDKENLIDVLDCFLASTKKKSGAEVGGEVAQGKRRTSSMTPLGGPMPSTVYAASGPAAKEQHDVNFALASGMRTYLHVHRLDPDNSLLGLQASARVVGSLDVDLAAMYRACAIFDADFDGNEEEEARQVGRDNSLPRRTLSAAVRPSISGTFFPSQYPTVTSRDLPSLFVDNLGGLPDASLLRRTRALIEILRYDDIHMHLWNQVGSLQRGDLVIAYGGPQSHKESVFESLLTATLGPISPRSYEVVNTDAGNEGHVIMRYAGSYSRYWVLGSDDVAEATPGAREVVKLRLHSYPEEVRAREIDVRLVVPLPVDIQASLVNHTASALEQVVDGPVSSTIRRILCTMAGNHTQLLEEYGVDTQLLARCTTMAVGMADLQDVEAQLALTTELLEAWDEKFGSFLQKEEKSVRLAHAGLVSDLDAMEKEYFPTRAARVRELLDLPICLLAKNRLNCLKLNLEMGVEHIQNLKAGLVDGREKQHMTSWWLGLIRSEQEKFFERLGYDETAVPHDYIGTPPASIDAVCDNLQMVTDCLSDQDPHRVKERLLYPLMETIYPKIHEFIANIRFSLCDSLGIAPEKFTLAQGKVLVKEQSKSPQHTAIMDLLKDYEYLEQIKLIELEWMGPEWAALCNPAAPPAAPLADGSNDVPDASSISELIPPATPPLSASGEAVRSIRSSTSGTGRSGGGLSSRDQNIVPISGLIMNVFYRRENELKTVLEVWAPERLEEFAPHVVPMPGTGSLGIRRERRLKSISELL